MQDDQDRGRGIRSNIQSAPLGTFKVFRATGVGIDSRSFDTFQTNQNEVAKRVRHALEVDCHIEAISLELQVMDYWLRLYFANKAPDPKRRRREIGGLLDQCRDLGLDTELYQELSAFNRRRIEVIHGFVIGRLAYEDVRAMTRDLGLLTGKLVIYVLENAGEP